MSSPDTTSPRLTAWIRTLRGRRLTPWRTIGTFATELEARNALALACRWQQHSDTLVLPEGKKP